MKDSGDSGSTAMLTTVFPVAGFAGGREAAAQYFVRCFSMLVAVCSPGTMSPRGILSEFFRT